MTYQITYSLGLDAANRQMQQAGRTAWNEDDASLAAQTLNLFMKHPGKRPENCECSTCKPAGKERSVKKQFIISAAQLNTRKPTHAGWVFRFTSTKKD